MTHTYLKKKPAELTPLALQINLTRQKFSKKYVVDRMSGSGEMYLRASRIT